MHAIVQQEDRSDPSFSVDSPLTLNRNRLVSGGIFGSSILEHAENPQPPECLPQKKGEKSSPRIRLDDEDQGMLHPSTIF